MMELRAAKKQADKDAEFQSAMRAIRYDALRVWLAKEALNWVSIRYACNKI